MQIKINEKLIGTNKTVLNENVEVYETLNECKDDYFIFGLDFECVGIEKQNPSYNGKNFFYFDMKITDWLPFLKNEYICPNGYFKQLWQLDNNDIGKIAVFNSKFNKSCKRFVIKNDADLDYLKRSTYEEELVYLSDASKILYTNYNRYWVVDGEIIAYCFDNNDNRNYAKKIIEQYYEPATRYTIDVVFDLTDNNFKVFDYNCFSTSEFLSNVDINKILETIK